MNDIVHLRIGAAEDAVTGGYDVRATFVGEGGTDVKEAKIGGPLDVRTSEGAERLWDELWQLVVELWGDKAESGTVVIRAHAPELHEVNFEGQARLEAEKRGVRPAAVLRTAVGPGGFQPDGPLPFSDLPARVLLVGTAPGKDDRADPWHEDVAVHRAVSGHAERWEVDVLPGPVRHETLAAALEAVEPEVLHLTGDAAHRLLAEGGSVLDGLNLLSVRLVVLTSDMEPVAAHRLLRPFTAADACDPVLAAVSLTYEPDSERDFCRPLEEFYRGLTAGDGVDLLLRTATETQATPGEAASGAKEGDATMAFPGAHLTSAIATVNCRPDLVLPVVSANGTHPDGPPTGDVHDIYEPLRRVADRVAQRKKALKQIEGPWLKKLVVMCGADGGNGVGTTCLLLSTIRSWERQPDRRALYLDFGKLGSTVDPRPADVRPQAVSHLIVETLALLAESVRGHREGPAAWGMEEELRKVENLVEEHRRRVAGGGHHLEARPVRDQLIEAAREFAVNAAPPGTHLVLALDHFSKIGRQSEKQRAYATQLVEGLFKDVLHDSGHDIRIVVTARHPDVEDRWWIERFTAEQHRIELHPWPAAHGGPLLRELGVRMGYDWHDTDGWRRLVLEKLVAVPEAFGPRFLSDVCSAALAEQIG
ncbi:hypothetical protein [Streptomyces sp. WAC 04229]|uniref:hypothetical protein n=1 Tax=Streptomyces sp. WAC 04229 TaxID=2203206 RepID=UPI003D72E212